MSEDKSQSPQELSEALAEEIAANEEFIRDIDKRIAAADNKYLQAILEEKKGYVRLAKKELQDKKDN